MSDTTDAKTAAGKLISDSFWMALSFVVLVVIAILLEQFSDWLVRLKLLHEAGFLFWMIRFVGYFLVIVDLAVLVGVVVNLAIRLLKSFWKTV